MTSASKSKTPWHLWVVGGLGLFWNGFGAYDYFMTNTKGADYMRSMGMTDAQIAHFAEFPAVMTAVWAVGVWGALLGTVLLLIRNKLAVPVFIASLVSFLISLVYAYLVAPLPDANAMFAVMQGIILAGCVFFVWYAMRMSKAGVLR